MNRFCWSGISSEERIKAMSDISAIVGKHATVLHFQRFSDLSLGLSLEMEECRVYELQCDLKNIMHMDGAVANLTDSKKDCMVLLDITFTKGTGDLEIEVPDIIE